MNPENHSEMVTPTDMTTAHLEALCEVIKHEIRVIEIARDVAIAKGSDVNSAELDELDADFALLTMDLETFSRERDRRNQSPVGPD
jgi:hypothetical protein